MSINPYQAFISLVNLDQEIRSLDIQARKVEREMHELRVTREESAAHLQLARNDMHDARKNVDEFELEMKELDDQLSAKKKQYEAITSQKEYFSIKAEMDAIKKKQHGLEGTLLESWRILEMRTKEYEIKKELYEQKDAELSRLINADELSVAQVREQITTKEAQRPAFEVVVPAEWLEKYGIMRMAVSDPVVSVDRGCCGACYNTLPEQVLNDLRRRKLMQCKFCYRLLYTPEALT